MENCLRLMTLTLLVAGALGQVSISGKCPEVQGMNPFDARTYMGRWYELRKYPTFFQLDGKCVTADYTLLEDSTVKVVNTQVDISTNTLQSIEGTAKVLAPGELRVDFPSAPSFTEGANYIVLSTDYVNYSVVYSCYQLTPDSTFQFTWILSRQRQLDSELMKKAERVLADYKISRKHLLDTDQINCPN